MKKELEIVFEDDHIVAINKGPGWLSIPDRFDSEKSNLYSSLKKTYGEIFTVHRLDKETSGILLFAKNAEAHKGLSEQFEARTIQKTYLALVDGVPSKSAGEITYGIAPDPLKAGKMRAFAKGKAAITRYEVKEVFKAASVVHCFPETGRTHQIRVHLAALGHPLLVDPLYGFRNEFFLSAIKIRKFRMGKGQEERPLLSRTPLHAYGIAFKHPTTGMEMDLHCDPPKDIRAVVNQLSKWAAV